MDRLIQHLGVQRLDGAQEGGIVFLKNFLVCDVPVILYVDAGIYHVWQVLIDLGLRVEVHDL